MNLTSVKAWLMQPTTVSGIGTLVGGVVGAATQYYSHDPAAAVTLFAAVKGVTSIVLPDNTAAQGSVEKLIKDAVTAAVAKNVAVSAGQLTGDVLNLLSSFTSSVPAPTPPVAAGSSAVPSGAAAPTA